MRTSPDLLHLVFGGDRAREFELRLSGASYEEIAREILAEGKNYAVVSVPRKDGTIQSVITWADADSIPSP